MFLFDIVFNDSCFWHQKGGDICFFVEKQFLLSRREILIPIIFKKSHFKPGSLGMQWVLTWQSNLNFEPLLNQQQHIGTACLNLHHLCNSKQLACMTSEEKKLSMKMLLFSTHRLKHVLGKVRTTSLKQLFSVPTTWIFLLRNKDNDFHLGHTK